MQSFDSHDVQVVNRVPEAALLPCSTRELGAHDVPVLVSALSAGRGSGRSSDYQRTRALVDPSPF